MAPTPGAWIIESIELVAPIAEGAMGKVWVAYHHRLKTRVAVKFVHEKVAGDDVAEAVARFEQEAAMAAQIKSAHVVQTYDSGLSSEGTPYIVMELLEGQSLGDRIRHQGPLAWTEAATVLAQVARALTKAHELGIVHRDVKPDNIFLCRSDDGIHCKVLDFGIAKQTRLPAMGGLTTDGKIVGTPEFMSPEMVLEDRPVDYRADLWALGVVMYVALTTQLPYNGKTLGQLCLNLVNRPPAAPSSLRPDLPPGADEWFLRALHREPAQRFDSAREMAASFAEVMGSDAIRASLHSPTLLASTRPAPLSVYPAPLETPTMARRRRARPVIAGLAGLAVLAVVAAVAVLARSGDGVARTPATSTVPAVLQTGRTSDEDDASAPSASPVMASSSATPESAPSASASNVPASPPAAPLTPGFARPAATVPGRPTSTPPPPTSPTRPSGGDTGRDLGF